MVKKTRKREKGNVALSLHVFRSNLKGLPTLSQNERGISRMVDLPPILCLFGQPELPVAFSYFIALLYHCFTCMNCPHFLGCFDRRRPGEPSENETFYFINIISVFFFFICLFLSLSRVLSLVILGKYDLKTVCCNETSD